MILRKLIGWPLCQAIYYIAHCSYLILDSLPDSDEEPGRLFRFLWRIYQGGMVASIAVNDWAGLSVWIGQPEIERERDGFKKLLRQAKADAARQTRNAQGLGEKT